MKSECEFLAELAEGLAMCENPRDLHDEVVDICDRLIALRLQAMEACSMQVAAIDGAVKKVSEGLREWEECGEV